MKLGSFKFCLLLSLLCHVAGFAVWQMLAPTGAPQKINSPVSAPLVVFSTDATIEKISPPPLKPATPALDKKLSKLFAAENFVPLKPLAMRPTVKMSSEEKHFAELARGQTAVAKSASFAEPVSNSVIVGTRMSRVFAVANIQPDYFKNPKPEYPELARREHQEGIVWLRVHVTAHGQPDRVVVAQSSGFEALDAAAVKTVRGWEFTPAQLGDAFVESEIDFPIQFKLD